MQKIIIYSLAWGNYVEVFKKIVKPSLQADIKKLKEEGYDIEIRERAFEMKELPIYTTTGDNSSDVIMKHLIPLIRQTIDENAIVFMAAADIIYGKNSIYNMVKLAENKPGKCIAFPHLRIAKEDYLKGINFNLQPTNRELVDIVFEHPHPAFTRAFDDKEVNSTNSGISIRKIDEKNYCLVASMPTIHLAQFTEEDYYFWNQNYASAGQWDRAWLGKLYSADRVRMVGSSDIAFGGELTGIGSNNPPLTEGLLNNDNMHQESREPLGEQNKALGSIYCSLIRA